MFREIKHEGGIEECGEPGISLFFSMLPLTNSCKNDKDFLQYGGMHVIYYVNNLKKYKSWWKMYPKIEFW